MFDQIYERFLTPKFTDKPMLLEAFTYSEDESRALEMITSIEVSAKGKAKDALEKIIGVNNFKNMKKLLRDK